MSKLPLKGAQIGCGSIAMGEHGPNMVRNPNVKIKWACDVKEENAKKYAEKFSAEKITKSFEEAVRDPEVDFICIATSPEIHVPIVELAAQNEKNIFCEKPMAMNEEQAYKIIKAVRKYKVKLCVNYMRRMAPAVQALKREWIKHKNNPQHQPWRYVELKREKFIEEKTTDFFVRVQDESMSYRLIHIDPFKGGGLIIGEAVHWLDLACWLFDDDIPVEVLAWGSPRMRYGIHLSFQSGNEATIIMTPNGTFDYPKEFYEIACNGALFRTEFFVENQYYGRPGIEKEIFPLAKDLFHDVGTGGGLQGYLKKHKKRLLNFSNLKYGWGDLLADHGYKAMFDGFIDSIINNSPIPCDEMAGYRATLLAEIAIQSIRLKKSLPVSPDKWDYYIHL